MSNICAESSQPSLVEVHQWNNEGVLDSIRSTSEVAQTKFRKAIQLIESIISTLAVQHRQQIPPTTNHHSCVVPMERDGRSNREDCSCAGGLPDEPCLSTFVHISSTPPAVRKTVKTSSICLYDEGMTTFSSSYNFTQIRQGDGIWRSFSIVTFNLGLSILRSMDRENDDGSLAMSFFEKSLALLCTKTPLHDNKRHDDNVQMMSKLFHNIAYIHYRNGRYSDALAAYGDTLKFIGDHRPRLTSATLNCIGVVQLHTSQQGEGFKGCLRLFHGALDALRNDGSDPCERMTRIATIVNNIARVQYMMGDYVPALESYDEAIAMRRQIYGPNHIDVAAVAFNMGRTYHLMGELELALQYFNEHLRIARLALSHEHRDMGDVLRHIAKVYYDRGEKDEALQTYEDALRAIRLALGHDHSDVAQILNKLGNVQYELGDLTAALQSYKEGLRIELFTLDSHHPNILVTRGNIARIHKNQGRFEDAMSEYQTILQLQRSGRKNHNLRDSASDDVSTATTIYNIGLVWYHMGEYEEAFDCYQHALHIRRESYGDNHLDVASTLNSIGLVLFRQGHVSCAVASFEECLGIRRELLGSEHRDVAVVLFNIATILFEQGDEDDAMKVFLETLRVERAVLGEQHPDVLQTVRHIGHLYQGRGDVHNAVKYFEESLRLQETLCKCSRQVGETLNHLGNLHLQLGATEKVMSYFVRAARMCRATNGEADGANGGDEGDGVVIAGYELYDMSKLHPECAAVA